FDQGLFQWCFASKVRRLSPPDLTFRGKLLGCYCRRVGQCTASGDSKLDAINAGLGSQKKGAPIRSTPIQVMRMLWTAECPEVLALGGEDPKSSWARDKKVAALVHFNAVDRVLSGRGGHIEKQLAFP